MKMENNIRQKAIRFQWRKHRQTVARLWFLWPYLFCSLSLILDSVFFPSTISNCLHSNVAWFTTLLWQRPIYFFNNVKFVIFPFSACNNSFSLLFLLRFPLGLLLTLSLPLSHSLTPFFTHSVAMRIRVDGKKRRSIGKQWISVSHLQHHYLMVGNEKKFGSQCYYSTV